MYKFIKNQYGVTLIELLAALTLFAVITGLVFSVLMNTFKYTDVAESHVNLRQNSNLIMTQLREQHQGNDEPYQICYGDLRRSEYINSVNINGEQLVAGTCIDVDPYDHLTVSLRMTDDLDHDFEIDTIVEGKRQKTDTIAHISIPSLEQDFYDYIREENIFVYGSTLAVDGSTSVGGGGTVVINNRSNSDLTFGGNNTISVENIYIDKTGNNVKFTNSTKLGQLGFTDIISIKGDVQLNNGGARMEARHIFIDGNVSFESSAVIKAENVYISGNVNFNNWSAKIEASHIYIGGTVSYEQSGNIIGEELPFDRSEYPNHPETNIPELRPSHWYAENGYQINVNNIYDGIKVYTEGDYVNPNWHPDTNNVIIVSQGDITIRRFGSSKLSGVLLAPNGKVFFDGAGFEGVVIARDGFHLTQGNTNVVFRTIDHYINQPSDFPFAN